MMHASVQGGSHLRDKLHTTISRRSPQEPTETLFPAKARFLSKRQMPHELNPPAPAAQARHFALVHHERGLATRAVPACSVCLSRPRQSQAPFPSTTALGLSWAG
jgi:hypothetical protein